MFFFDDGYLYQFYNGGYCQVYDFDTKEFVNDFTIPVGHANSVTFDPLTGYVYSFDVNNTCYVFTVSTSGYTMIRTLVFNDGYYTYGGAYNNKLYTISYTQNSYRDDTDNHMICCVWDLTNLTDNGNSTCTPAIIKSFSHPFIYSVQDVSMFFGRLYILSSYDYTESPTKIIALDFDSECIKTVIDNIPTSLANAEQEGLTFVEYPLYYTMLLGTFGGYYEFNFNV